MRSVDEERRYGHHVQLRQKSATRSQTNRRVDGRSRIYVCMYNRHNMGPGTPKIQTLQTTGNGETIKQTSSKTFTRQHSVRIT